jgi:hypothetical protein
VLPFLHFSPLLVPHQVHECHRRVFPNFQQPSRQGDRYHQVTSGSQWSSMDGQTLFHDANEVFLSILSHDSPPASISSSPTHESTSSRQSMLLPLVLATSSEIVFLVPFLFSGIFQWQGRKWCIDKIEHYTKNARYSSIRVQWKSRTGIPLQNYLMPSKIFAILQETNHRLVFDPPIRHFTRSQAIAIGNFYALHGSCTVEILHENLTKLQGNSRKDHIPLLPSLSCFASSSTDKIVSCHHRISLFSSIELRYRSGSQIRIDDEFHRRCWRNSSAAVYAAFLFSFV